MAEKRKRRISKCEVCPYFAKNHEKGKWECSVRNFNETKLVDEEGVTIADVERACIFDSLKVTANLEEKNAIIERWIRANE